MRFNTIIILLFSFSLFLEAENFNKDSGFRLEVAMSAGRVGETVYLLKYWEGNTYIQDSVSVSAQGTALFTSADNLPGGQYLVYVKPDIKLELLIDREQSNIKVYVDEQDIMQSKVEGNSDTELFWKYLLALDKYMNEDFALDDMLEKSNITETERTDISKKKTFVSEQLNAYMLSQIEQHKGTWFSDFVKGTMSPELPADLFRTAEDLDKNRAYLKEHYFDNIDLTDPRFWNTNYFPSYLDAYMKSVVEQEPDSLAAAAGWLVAKAMQNDFCFEKMLSRFVNESIESQVMGVENVWMYLYETYIRGKNIEWIDKSQLGELERQYVQSEHNRIGVKAHDLELQTIGGDKINIYDVQSDYILLYFYNPTCDYCEKELPYIYNVYKEYKDKGLEVMAIDISTDAGLWKSFVEKLGIKDWINCADAEYKSNFWMYYDVSTTPATFLLDKNRKIIARKVNKDGLVKTLNYYIDK